MTIHITPEPQCSYVSFESNVSAARYDELLARVLAAFRPSKFIVTVFATPVSIVHCHYTLLHDAPHHAGVQY